MLVKPGRGVDLVDHHLVVGGEEHVDTSHAAAAQGLVGLHRDSANFVVDLRGDSGRDYHLRALIVDILGVVGVKTRC